jgi:oligopeptide/dipeptide ABC transporter ATP-binding protein
MSLLNVQNVDIAVATENGLQPIVSDLSFSLNHGETLGIVGESGCGKSLTSLAVMGLLPHPQVQITAGNIEFDGMDLLTLNPAKRRDIMGNKLAMIFQEPMTSLNPVYTVGDQIIEAIRQHKLCTRKVAMDQAIDLLGLVGIPDPKSRIRVYPHQLSGGMRQRVMIAMALSCDPVLLIADEPTTALDVTVQAQILDLLNELQKKNGMAVMLISHDLGVIAEMTDRTCVMYRGRSVEMTTTKSIFDNPYHPYTVGLLQSIPQADTEMERLSSIPGFVPPVGEIIPGCAFNPRCSHTKDKCVEQIPTPEFVDVDHQVSCHFPVTTQTERKPGGGNA